MSYNEIQNAPLHKHKMGRLDLKVGHAEKPNMGQKWDTITQFWTAPVVVVIVVANIVEWHSEPCTVIRILQVSAHFIHMNNLLDTLSF